MLRYCVAPIKNKLCRDSLRFLRSSCWPRGSARFVLFLLLSVLLLPVARGALRPGFLGRRAAGLQWMRRVLFHRVQSCSACRQTCIYKQHTHNARSLAVKIQLHGLQVVTLWPASFHSLPIKEELLCRGLGGLH